jgi:hypothetical protein
MVSLFQPDKVKVVSQKDMDEVLIPINKVPLLGFEGSLPLIRQCLLDNTSYKYMKPLLNKPQLGFSKIPSEGDNKQWITKILCLRM